MSAILISLLLSFSSTTEPLHELVVLHLQYLFISPESMWRLSYFEWNLLSFYFSYVSIIFILFQYSFFCLIVLTLVVSYCNEEMFPKYEIWDLFFWGTLIHFDKFLVAYTWLYKLLSRSVGLSVTQYKFSDLTWINAPAPLNVTDVVVYTALLWG